VQVFSFAFVGIISYSDLFVKLFQFVSGSTFLHHIKQETGISNSTLVHEDIEVILREGKWRTVNDVAVLFERVVGGCDDVDTAELIGKTPEDRENLQLQITNVVVHATPKTMEGDSVAKFTLPETPVTV
jgi:hypothetical protein